MKNSKQLSIYLLILTTILLQFNNCNCDINWYFHDGFDEFVPSPHLNITDKSGVIPLKLSFTESLLLTVKKTQEELNNNYGRTNNVADNKQKFRAIVPGTLWCGDGNKAKNDNELGSFYYADSCCRQHDKCSFNIATNTVYGPLYNNGLFTRSACHCDRSFYKCLQSYSNMSDIISYKIGSTYFNVLQPQCIAYVHPQKPKCNAMGMMFYNECWEPFRPDTSKPKKLQWLNSPPFY